jgi:AcrR family transcriptional regulator
MLQAAVEIVLADGYGALSEIEISDRAGVWRDTFYRTYEDAEDCFVAAIGVLGAEGLRSAMHARKESPTWPVSVRCAFGGLIDHIIRDHRFREVVFEEACGAGPAAVEATMKFARDLVSVLVDGAPRAVRGPQETGWLAAGTWHVLAQQLQAGNAEQLRAVGNQLTYIVVAPFIGSDGAIEMLETH